MEKINISIKILNNNNKRTRFVRLFNDTDAQYCHLRQFKYKQIQQMNIDSIVVFFFQNYNFKI